MTFWNKYTKRLSTQIWIPDELSKNSKNDFTSLGTQRWFNVEIQRSSKHRTKQPITRHFNYNCITTPEIIKEADDDKGYRTQKIKIYPNEIQKDQLNKWFDGCRWTYNKCVEYFKQSNNKLQHIYVGELRELFVNEACNKEYPFLENSPRAVRDRAALEFATQYKTNRKKVFDEKITHFDMKFRSRKQSQAITIEKRDFDCKTPRSGFYFLKHIETSRPLFQKNREYARVVNILKTELGEYYFTIIEKKQLKSEKQANQFSKSCIDGVISLDPGVRTFMVGYDPFKEQIINLGDGAIDAIRNLNEKIGKLNSKMKTDKKLKNKQKLRLRKRIQRVRKTLKNIIRDMHHKIAKWLCKNYKIILLPKFNVSGMVKRDKRIISKKTVDGMLGLCHYKFRQRLLAKSRQYKNCKVLLVNESYTSKTCGQCGKINHTLGSKKIFKCKKEKGGCGLVIGRDINGARNIFIKNVE